MSPAGDDTLIHGDLDKITVIGLMKAVIASHGEKPADDTTAGLFFSDIEDALDEEVVVL